MRAAAIGLSALLAVCAVPVGGMLIAAPDGHLLGASVDVLVTGLPFTSLLLPGLILGGVIGGGALLVGFAQLLRARAAPLVTTVYGVTVMGWILVQLALTHGASPLHAITFVLGAALVAAGGARDWLGWVATNAIAGIVGSLHGLALGALLRRSSFSLSEGEVHGVEQHAGRGAAVAGR